VSTERTIQSGSPRIAWWKALLLIVPIAAWTGLLTLMPDEELMRNVSGWVTWLVFVSLFFLILVTGRTNRYRSILFILMAVMLPLYFIPGMLERYGTMALTEGDFLDAGAAFCPLAFPMIIVPAAFTRTMIFPSVLLGTSGIIGFSAILLASSLATGRGWCSWGCFYGGWDELFSRLPKKPLIKKIDRRWIYLPFGVLLAVVLTSAFTLSITYCEWLCPFKVLTEFAAPTSPLIIVQTVLFVLAFVGLVVVLPLLTKRRVQCALFCPLGALQSLWNKINIFEVRIDREMCGDCSRCIRECPTLSLDEKSLQTGTASITCTRCGKCIDVCTKGAISYHVKGTRLGVKPNVARVLFLYPSWIIMAMLGAGIVQSGIWRILRLVTTGSMLR
jgi:ferredoxin-type protein NapH